MKRLLISLIFVLSFFLINSSVSAQEVNTNEYTIYGIEAGVSKQLEHTKLSSGEYLDDAVCEYYLDDNHSTGNDFTIMKAEDNCFVVPFINMDSLKVKYNNPNTTEDEVHSLGEDDVEPNNSNGTSGGGASDDVSSVGAHSIVGYLSQDNLNLYKVVYEVNKGSLANKFKSDYNLTYLKAASIGDKLYVQYAQTGGSIVTLKMTYSKNGSSNVLQSTEVSVSSITSNILSQFPFWILEAAPNYNAEKIKTHSKSDLLAAFKDITNYEYKESGGKYTVSATIPDNINNQVLAVFSSFLDDVPIESHLEDAAASTEGEPTDDSEKTVKNTKTGAFINIGIVAIGFIVAFIGGYLVYRYSKIRKI